MSTINYNDIITTIGFGKMQYLLLFTSGILRMMPVNESMGMAMIVVAAKCDIAMNVDRISIVIIAPFLGMILSAYFWGYLCDIVGRKKILLITTFAANVSSWISVLMPRYWLFVAARFVTGIFLAGPASIPVTYLSEFCTIQNGTQVINWMAAFTGLSMLYCATIGMNLLTTKWAIPIYDQYKFTPWRLQILLYTLPGLIGALILIALPESPNYLIAIGREIEGMEALDWLCMKSIGKHLDEVIIRHTNETNRTNTKLKSTLSMGKLTELKMFEFKVFWSETLPLFRKPMAVNFLLSCLIMMGLMFTGNGMGVWFPTMRGLHRHDINLTGTFEKGTFCESFSIRKHDPFAESTSDSECLTVQRKSALDSIILGITYLVCFTCQGILLHFIGRKKTMMFVFALGCLNIIVVSFSVNDFDRMLIEFCLFLTLPAISFSMLASGVVIFTPTRLRAKAVCLVYMIGRMGAVAGVYIFLASFDTPFCDVLLYMLSAFYVGGIIILYILPVD